MCRADEGSDSEQEEEHDDGGGETVLGISAENALHNYNWAGTSVAEARAFKMFLCPRAPNLTKKCPPKSA